MCSIQGQTKLQKCANLSLVIIYILYIYIYIYIYIYNIYGYIDKWYLKNYYPWIILNRISLGQYNSRNIFRVRFWDKKNNHKFE